MRHTKKKLITLSIYTLFMTAMYGGYVGSLTWFDNRSTLPDDFEGESGKAFFGGGDGSSTSPYQIKTARHFYNLCWLQYLGRFNKDTNGDKVIDQIYFSLENDIDCKDLGSALPPIGTTRYPFVGNFNGNDHIIKNYTITDEYSELKKHPSIIDTENTYYTQENKTINYCSIIGTFGVIGYNTTGATDVTSDETSLYDKLKVNSVSNLYIDNVTIKPATKNTLAGLLAGYVSANMSGCGVHYSNLNFSNGNTNISADKFNGKLSNYALIGDYNSTDYDWDGHSGQNNDFGGSIDMLSINKRLNYITSSLKNKNKSLEVFDSDKYGLGNINISGNARAEAYWKANSVYYYYLGDNTFMPLNINIDALSEEEITLDNGWHSNNFYENGNEEEILSTNTGYIVGAKTGTNGIIRSRIQTLVSGSYGGIYKSQGYDKSQSNKQIEYDPSRMELLTIDLNGTTYRIKDKYNSAYYSDDSKSYLATLGYSQKEVGSGDNQLNLVEYDKVVKNFATTMSGATNVHGFHFMKYINTSNLETAKHDAYIGDNKIIKKDYCFVKGGLNFSLKKQGYITSILGTFFSPTGKQSFYDLYEVKRSSDNTSITSCKQIKKIYSSNINNQYVYEYYGDTSFDTTGLTKIFDFDLLNPTLSNSNAQNPLITSSAYYFEFPLNKGDYVIGASSSVTSANAYLMYLDIGANAGDSGEDEKEGKLENIDFYYYENNQLVKVTAGNASNVVFDISGDGSAVFYFNRILEIGVLYYDEDVKGLTRTQPSAFTGTPAQATDKNCKTKVN